MARRAKELCPDSRTHVNDSGLPPTDGSTTIRDPDPVLSVGGPGGLISPACGDDDEDVVGADPCSRPTEARGRDPLATSDQ